MGNSKTLGGDRPMQRRGTLGRRLRALFLSVAAGSLVVASSSAFAENPEHGELKVGSKPGTIVLQWTGPIAAPMAQQIQSAFEQRKDQSARVVLTLASGGGSVAEGEKVIRVLRQIRKTHRLQTVVGHGRSCGSMCVFIYLQGEKRTAALSSLWLFHEVSKKDRADDKKITLDRVMWERLVETYYGPAGVSAAWTAKMKPFTIKSDYWQTGADLVNDNSGIVHEALGNLKPRMAEYGKQPAPGPRADIPERLRRPTPEVEGVPPPPAPVAEPRREQPDLGGYKGPSPVRIAEPRPERIEPVGKSVPAPERPAEPRANPEPEKECKVFVPSWGVSMTLPCSAAAQVK